MVEQKTFPLLVGYHPEEAEAMAAKAGIAIRWVTAETPRWLSESHEARVGRQRVGADGVLELLQVLIPVLPMAPAEDGAQEQ